MTTVSFFKFFFVVDFRGSGVVVVVVVVVLCLVLG